MDLAQFWRTLRMLYLLRISVGTLLLLAVLGPFANGSSLLENLLELSAYPSDIFQVSLGAFLLAYAAVTTMNLAICYGNLRFPDSSAFCVKKHRRGLIFFLGTVAPAIFMYSVIRRTESPAGLSTLMAFAGFALALILVILADLVQ